MVTFSPPENIIHFIWEFHMCLVHWGISQLWSAWYKKPRWSCGADYLHNYDLINRIRIRDSSWILSFTSKHIKYTTSQGYLNENHDRLATFTSRNSTSSIPSNSSKELETHESRDVTGWDVAPPSLLLLRFSLFCFLSYYLQKISIHSLFLISIKT